MRHDHALTGAEIAPKPRPSVREAAPTSGMSGAHDFQNVSAIVDLGERLKRLDYQFTTVTPVTHALLNSRAANQTAQSLRDVCGWSRPFEPRVLPDGVFDAMRAAQACQRVPNSWLWRPLLRFSTLDGLLFAHSSFPTCQRDAVFFGPDSYRFVRTLKQYAPHAQRIVDLGCGSGVGGISLSQRGYCRQPVVLADINSAALRAAEVNAQLAGIPAEIIESDLLAGVEGDFDLVIANPPYLRDDAERVYRDGGGDYGEALSVQIVRQALDRLSRMPRGGTLLLYTGSAIVAGNDTFLNAVRRDLGRPGIHFIYEELDPDVFADELENAQYAGVERLAAVFLQVNVPSNR